MNCISQVSAMIMSIPIPDLMLPRSTFDTENAWNLIFLVRHVVPRAKAATALTQLGTSLPGL